MEIVTVRMADMAVVRGDTALKTVLGSCVAVILRDAERLVSGLAHIMLPRMPKQDSAAAKYADTAIPGLVELMVREGGRRGSLQALLVGGARMFPWGHASIAAIGDLNGDAARSLLRGYGIPILFEDLGGTAGRVVVFEGGSGRVSVKSLAALKGAAS